MGGFLNSKGGIVELTGTNVSMASQPLVPDSILACAAVTANYAENFAFLGNDIAGNKMNDGGKNAAYWAGNFTPSVLRGIGKSIIAGVRSGIKGNKLSTISLVKGIADLIIDIADTTITMLEAGADTPAKRDNYIIAGLAVEYGYLATMMITLYLVGAKAAGATPFAGSSIELLLGRLDKKAGKSAEKIAENEEAYSPLAAIPVAGTVVMTIITGAGDSAATGVLSGVAKYVEKFKKFQDRDGDPDLDLL
jgi:hypothetical protein